MTILYDLETDNLLFDVTTIHCGVCYVVEENKYYSFTSRPIKGSSGSIKDMLKLLQKATLLVAHNGIKYDNAVIRKLYSIDLFTSTKYFDTLIASQLRYPNMLLIDNNNKYIPKTLKGRHSLASWGYRLNLNKGTYGKEDNAWDVLSEDMLNYCIRDVELLLLLYNKLKDQVPEEAMRLEQKFAYIIGRQEEYGVLFDVDKAQQLHIELVKEQEIAIEELYKVFTPLKNWVSVNKANEFNKDGTTSKNYLRQLGRGCFMNEDLDWGYFEEVTFNPKSGAHIVRWVEHLYGKQKWTMTDKGSPKTGEDDLIRMFSDKEWAKPLVHYLEVKKLLGQLAEGNNAWLKLVKDDNRIHGEVNTLGAVSRRCTHTNPNLAQVPSPRAYKGHECRALFIVPKGKKIVGCDADALELRTLSHYMARFDGGSYGEAVDLGDKAKGTDIHTLNQKAAGLPTRDDAKTFIYAFLYGAGAEKLGTIIGGSAKEGNKLKTKFFHKIPAIKQLVEGVGKTVKEKGFLKALDGNRYFIRSEHSALNTLLQGAGALVMKYYACCLYDKLISKYKWGDDFAFLLNVHDEVQLEVNEDIAEDIAKICEDTFEEVTELLKFRIKLKGQANVGINWASTH